MTKSLEEQLKHRPADPGRVAELKAEMVKQIPKPLWPLPDGGRPFVRRNRLGNWEVRFDNGYVLTERHHLDAMNYAREEAHNLALSTEYVQRREALAKFLLELVYGEGAWSQAMWDEREDLVLNYRLDADDIIKANPHLLSLEERERLAAQIPELAYP